MDLFKTLKLKPVQFEPDIWVSRLMILEQIAPAPVVIRDISLTCGLNIIWAEEAEDDMPSAEITGHSAGKTTFCRLLRYVLGERTFGTKTAMELVRKTFPDGYVAAQIHVRGQKWVIRRPFGSGRMSFVMKDASIEELLAQRGRSVTQESYPQVLGLESLLDELETGGIVQTGELIQWEHILAWCARDQETRFQNIHDWRSPRSEAETPSFRFPKAGPLFLMRAVLGLFMPDELKGEERLAGLQRDKDRLAKEIEKKRQEPQFRVNLYDYQLRQSLKSFLPEESEIDLRPFRSNELFIDDLERLTNRAQQNAENSIEKNEQVHRTLQTQVDVLGAELERLKLELGELDSLFSLNNAACRELEAGPSNREKQRKDIEEYKDKKCPLGGVIFRDCKYVQDRQRILQITEFQDAHVMAQDEIRRGEECQEIEAEKDRIRKEMERIKEKRQSVFELREALLIRIQEQRNSIRDLAHTRDELVIWMQKNDRPDGYEELDLLRRKLDNTEAEIIKVENELRELLRQHDENRERLAGIFSEAVRTVLSANGYDGWVNMKNRELTFRITHGPAMSGEAVETLSVLLADVVCLIYNTVSGKSHLPGFLIHDSPREADLGLSIYRSFIRFAASLQEHFDDSSTCPFQYIITTTTAPPEELRSEKHVKLPLNAATPDGLLLRRNIALTRDQNRSLWEDTI